jgi:ADP-heptose:LPS heptosyltransferase
MKILALKKKIISSSIGIFFDEKLRIFLSVIPFIHSIFSFKNSNFKPDCFIFFLHGGIGDALLVFPLIKKLSIAHNVIVFCEGKIINLGFLLPECISLIQYEKNQLFQSRKRLKQQINGKNPLFVQTSPIIEIYIIRWLLEISKAIGVISNFNSIRSIGFGSDVKILNTHSKIDMYEKIYQQIAKKFKGTKLIFNSQFSISKLEGECIPINGISKKYVVLSAMKTSEWKMGKMSSIEYAKLADFLAEKYGYQVVFVGDESERLLVDDIIKLCVNSTNMMNIAGRTGFRDLANVLSKAKFVISNDNGISHLASFLQLNVLVLFMFSDYKVYQWNYPGYAYLFNEISNCMPCVKQSQYPKDNYPVNCPNQLICNSSITAKSIICKIKNLGWT